MIRTLPILLALAFIACSEQPSPVSNEAPASGTPGTATTPAPSASGPAQRMVTSDSRDEWMRPDVVLGMMNNDLSGMTVADLFAGDGYFTFRLIQAGAKVIAIDNDPANIAKLEARKKELGLTDDQLIVRGAAVGDPGLAPDEADVALLVHHYVGIANKPDFFKRMRQGLRFPRALMLIDWQKQPTPMGPPEHERLDQNLIMDQILEMGYSEVGAHSDKLPYQVVFFATDPMDAL